MPVEKPFWTIAEPGVAVLRFREHATCDDLLAALRDLASDPALTPGAPVLVDTRAALFLPTQHQVLEIAALLAEERWLRGHRVAVVVGPGAQFGMARMISMMSELRGGVAGAFLDQEHAMTWLVPDPATGGEKATHSPVANTPS